LGAETGGRRLAAILAADVVGYSRLIGADEPGTLAKLAALRSNVIDPQMVEYGGRVFKTTGDGLLAEFPSAVQALRCAIAIQDEVREQTMCSSCASVSTPRTWWFRTVISLVTV
jgi:adenylate cyclase